MADDVWDGEIEAPAPNQWLRLGGLLASAALIAAIFGMKPSQLSPSGVLGFSLLATAALSATLYFTWMRGGPSWRPIATTAGLFVAIMLVNLNKADQNMSMIKADAETFGSMYFDATGKLVVPTDESRRGPFSRITIAIVTDVQTLNDEYMRQLEEAGMFALLDAGRLENNPDVVRRCDVILAVKSDIPEYKARHLALIDKGRREFGAVDVPADVLEAALAGMDRTMAETRSDIERTWDLNAAQIVEAHAGCQILARRNWQAQGRLFAFTSQSDLDAFNRHSDRLNALAGQIDAIARAGQERMKESQQALMRAFK